MTVESKYTIAIAALCDWLKKLAAVFQTMGTRALSNNYGPG